MTIRRRCEQLTVLVVFSVLGAQIGMSATKYWTGRGDGTHWADVANWSGGKQPAAGDSVHFTNDTAITVSLAKFNGTSVTTTAISGWNFKGKDVVFTGGTLNGQGKTPYVNVVEAGTTVVISNNFNIFNKHYSEGGPCFTKKGAGTVLQVPATETATISFATAETPADSVTIEEGAWVLDLQASRGYGTYVRATNVWIKAGAKLVQKGYNGLATGAAYRVDGIFELRTGDSQCQIASLAGTGTVSAVEGGKANLIVTDTISPGGDGEVGTLTVGCALIPNKSGVFATYVCDVIGAACDKLVLSKGLEFDLSNLNFRVAEGSDVHLSGKVGVMTTAKQFKNEFKSVDVPDTLKLKIEKAMVSIAEKAGFVLLLK